VKLDERWLLVALGQGLTKISTRIVPKVHGSRSTRELKLRAEQRARVLASLRGLLGQPERRNGWTLAEAAGEVSPDGMQRLLRTADWNADAVRDQLRAYWSSGSGPAGS
jgi:hypothetical protein